MPIKSCEVCGAGFAQGRGRPSKYCPKHRDGGGRYGGEHRKLRETTKAAAYGRPCARCQKPMLPGQELHLDHADGGGPVDYLGWSHAYCNTTAPHRTNGQRAPGGPSAVRPEVVVIPPVYEPGSIRHRPECVCGGSVVYEPGEWWTSRCW
jgi:hypothetical protein